MLMTIEYIRVETGKHDLDNPDTLDRSSGYHLQTKLTWIFEQFTSAEYCMAENTGNTGGNYIWQKCTTSCIIKLMMADLILAM